MNRMNGWLGLVTIAAGTVGVLAVASPVKANLEVCNRSDRGRVMVAIAYPVAGNRWNAEGWLDLDDGECGTLVSGDLTNRYYYYFAQTAGQYFWKGNHRFCVSNRKFLFADADKMCKGINSRWENFRELDTGKDTTGYTLNLE